MTTPSEPGSSIGSTSSSLLDRVKAQDQDAWRRLVRLYGPLVDFWVRRTGLQAADAEDVFQETFRAVAQNIGTFQKTRPAGSFRSWLRTITRTKVVDHHRRRSSQPEAVGGPEAEQQLLNVVAEQAGDGDDQAEAAEVEALRRRALEMIRAEFEEKTWLMFWRITAEDREVKEVAEEFGVTPSAVRLAKSRVLRRLREEMEGLEP
jgi:RNA polymerase sigma-70 factor (ECF subfamily)